jgi:hypothetical protein
MDDMRPGRMGDEMLGDGRLIELGGWQIVRRLEIGGDGVGELGEMVKMERKSGWRKCGGKVKKEEGQGRENGRGGEEERREQQQQQ